MRVSCGPMGSLPIMKCSVVHAPSLLYCDRVRKKWLSHIGNGQCELSVKCVQFRVQEPSEHLSWFWYLEFRSLYLSVLLCMQGINPPLTFWASNHW